MKVYVFKRVIMFLITFFLLVSLIYFLLNISMLKIWTRGYTLWDLIEITYRQYVPFVKGVITENYWGIYSARKTVWEHVNEQMITTLKINVYALLIYLPLGIILGMVTAYYKGKFIDKLISYFILLMGSVPEYVTILFLVLIFGYKLQWFPALYDPNPDNLWAFILSLAIPMIAMTAIPIVRITRLLRAEVIESMDQDYTLLVKSKGFKKTHIILRHSLKNSIIPVISALPRIFSWVLTMSFLIEVTYNIGGAGNLFYRSMIVPSMDGSYIDINVQVAVLISSFYVFMILIIYFLSDIALILVDPRIKITGAKLK